MNPTTLNTHADGPYAYSDQEQVIAWNDTQALLEAGESNIGSGTEWSDFDDAHHISECYDLDADNITARGYVIIDAAIRGEDYESMMNEWADEIFTESFATPYGA